MNTSGVIIYDQKQVVSCPVFDDKKLELMKSTICKGASDDEFELFLHACQRTGLDPFMKQIYAVFRWDDKAKKNVMQIQTAIDGYRLIAERTGKYSPGREPTFTYNDKGCIISSTAYVKKQTADGTWHEVAATAFYHEYCQKTKQGEITRFWRNMAHTMTAKCAESLALRKAFPADLSGLYTKEEMMQADLLDAEEDKIEPTKISEPLSVAALPEPKKKELHFIDKSQIVSFNEKYEKLTSEIRKKVDAAVDSLCINDLSEMQIEDWKKFMISFDKYLAPVGKT